MRSRRTIVWLTLYYTEKNFVSVHCNHPTIWAGPFLKFEKHACADNSQIHLIIEQIIQIFCLIYSSNTNRTHVSPEDITRWDNSQEMKNNSPYATWWFPLVLRVIHGQKLELISSKTLQSPLYSEQDVIQTLFTTSGIFQLRKLPLKNVRS